MEKQRNHGLMTFCLAVCTVAVTLSLGVFSTTAFADETDVVEEQQEQVVQNETDEEAVASIEETLVASDETAETTAVVEESPSSEVSAPVEETPVATETETVTENVVDETTDEVTDTTEAVDAEEEATADDAAEAEEATTDEEASEETDGETTETEDAADADAAAEATADDATDDADDATIDSEELLKAADTAERTIADGLYEIKNASATSKSVGVSGGSTTNNTAVVSAADNNETYQRFFFQYDESAGYYRIYVLKSGMALAVSTANKIVQTTTATLSQLWEVINNSGTYSLKNYETGLLMTLSGSNYIAKAGTTPTTAQKFTLTAADVIANGIYTIRCTADTSLAITVEDGSSSPTAKIKLEKLNSYLSQKYQVVRVGSVGSGLYRIRTAASGGWLTASGSTSGSQVKQMGNSKTAATAANTWKVFWNGDHWSLRNQSNGYVLSFAHAEAGKILKTYKANGEDKQHFEFVAAPLIKNGIYYVKSLYNSKYLSIKDNSISNKGNALVNTKKTLNSYKFRFKKTGSYYYISNFFSGKYLTVLNGSKKNGANVAQYTLKNAKSQRWYLQIADGGGLLLVNENSGYALNLSSSGNKNANQGKLSGSTRQSWQLTAAPARGWYRLNNHWRFKSSNSSAVFEQDLNLSGKRVGHYDVLRDIWLKIRYKASKTKYLIASSWDSCYVAVFEGKKGSWNPLYGFNCANGNPSLIEAENRVENPYSTWSWSPSFSHYLALGNIKSRMPELPSNNQWAAKLNTTFAGSRVRKVNANEQYFTSIKWTLGYHTYLKSKSELGKHLSHGCQRLAYKWAKWIYKNVRPGTRCIQLRTKAYS